MKPAPFRYHRPGSLNEALKLLTNLPDARPLSGGQSLMPMMNMRLASAEHLIDLNPLTDLAGIELSNGRVDIGAMTRQRDLLTSEQLQKVCPILAQAVSQVGHLQTRNRGTIGGSLAHLDPAAELPGICALHDARITAAGHDGQRTIAMADFAKSFMTTDLGTGEIITRISFDAWPAGHGWDFREHSQRHGDFAVVGAGALVLVDHARITRAALVLIGVAEAPLRLHDVEDMISGQTASAALFAAAGALARNRPMLSDHLVTEGYRQHLADVLVCRSLATAVERADA